MMEIPEKLKGIEDQIEKALWTFEVHDKIEQALAVYLEAESKLAALNMALENPAFTEQQRILSYCLMRQGNILRQKGKPEEALALGERELNAARASNDEITLARSLMSNGTNKIISAEMEKGLGLLEEARGLFERGDSHDHIQGLGWYWILQADLANAGILKKGSSEVIEIANRSLEILKPIENWPGVARAFAARAKAYENLGNADQAAMDRKEQQENESKVGPEENGG